MYLPQALDSVAALSVDREHIVVDGGSTDGTVEILEGRDDPSLEWITEPDRGQTDAVNKGLARTTGEVIGWLNADDEWMPDAVDRAVNAMLADPGIDAVYGGMEIVDENGAMRRRYVPARWSWNRYLFLGDYIPTPSILFRRRVFERVGPLDERYVDAADYDFYLRVFHGARVENRGEPLFRFRYHPDSKTVRDVWVQQREALTIRRTWARRPWDAPVMTGIDTVKRWVLPKISPWPKPFA